MKQSKIKQGELCKCGGNCYIVNARLRCIQCHTNYEVDKDE